MTAEPDERGAYGYFVVRRGILASEPFEVGDQIDVYPVLEPFDAARFQRLRDYEWHRSISAPQLPLLPDQIDFVAGAVADGRQDLEVHLRIFCPCAEKNPSTIATVGTTDTGLTWVVVGRERVPRAFRTENRPEGRKASLLHPRISTHYEVTTCKHSQVWGVEMAYTHIRILRLGRPTWGARVAP